MITTAVIVRTAMTVLVLVLVLVLALVLALVLVVGGHKYMGNSAAALGCCNGAALGCCNAAAKIDTPEWGRRQARHGS